MFKIFTMKKLLFILLFGGFTSFAANAQRVAVVEITRILESMDDYKKGATEAISKTQRWIG